MTSEQCESWITIHDILDQVPVSARTIRSWTTVGLMPRPILASKGYRAGVQGLYPPIALPIARTLYALRYMSLNDRRRVMENHSSYRYEIEEDGTLTITVPVKYAKRRQKE